MTVLLHILFFVLGAGAGFLYARRQPSDLRVKELETLLTDLQGRHENYQHAVASHFEHSAELVNELTQRYRDMHQHLVDGARTLCENPRRASEDNPANNFQRLESPVNPSLHYHSYGHDIADLADFEPPRDYATKQPSDKGMLDERFGFK